MSSVNHAGSVLWCANFDPCFAILSGVKFPSYLAARCETSHLIITYSLLSVAHLHYLVPPPFFPNAFLSVPQSIPHRPPVP